MDIGQLAATLTLVLTPFLPVFLKVGEKATEEVGKQLGGEAFGKAKLLWQKLHPKVEARPSAQEAFEDAAKSPDDPDTLSSLRQQIKKILSDDKTFAQEMEKFVETLPTSVRVTASGDGSVAMGGSATNSPIITGNNNTLK